MSDAPDDPIRPTRIEHHVQDIWEEDGRLEESYNFLNYHFEGKGVRCWARAYVDEMHEVALFGPYGPGPDDGKVAAPAFVRDVLLYLQRRFETVVHW